MEHFTELSLILVGILLSTNAYSLKVTVRTKLASYESNLLGVRTSGLGVTEMVGL